MLVLSRSVYRDVAGFSSSRENEVVVILEDGRRIVFTLLPHGHSVGRIRVGIEAPRELMILRGELDELPEVSGHGPGTRSFGDS